MQFSNFDELVARVAQAIVGEGEYLLSLVGMAEDAPGKPIRFVAGAGAAIGYMQGLVCSWSEELPEGQGPAGRAVRTGKPQVTEDSVKEPRFTLWRNRAELFGIHSSVAIPFDISGHTAGVIMVYAREPNAFGPLEIELLQKLGREVAFAIAIEEGRSRLLEAETARGLAEAAFRESQAELARVARLMSIGEFASSMAHEVNQPVGAIMANAGAALRWLDRDPPNLEEVRAALDRIVRDAERTGSVIGRARAKLAKAPAAVEPLDINQLLVEALSFVQSERGAEGLRIETEFARDLPRVTCDRVQIQQVAVNLMVNAMDAMRGLTDRRRVLSIRSRLVSPEEIMVEVADTGTGFHDGGEHRVFEHFFTTKPEGLGLGLPISRSIIEGCGGALTASPNTPFGAVFTFTLPVTGAEA